MTATLARPARGHRAEHRAERGSPARATGAWTLTRFALRRDRVRLPLWIAAAAGLVGIQSVSSQGVYDSPGALEAYARAAEASAAVVAMTGRPVGLDTVARAVSFEIFATVAVVVCLMAVFTVVRHTRTDEEAGRAELVLSAQVGRRAPLLAALAVATAACAAVAVAVGLVGVVTGLPAEGSWLLGASLGGTGLVLAGVAAVAAQVSEHGRAASAIGGVAIGVAFLLRAVGDVQQNVLSWLSPMGWGQAAYPFHLDRWWPLLLQVGTAVALAVVAVALLDRRDVDAGLIRPRPGRRSAGPLLRGPLGLAWRLQRASFLGWGAGIVVTAVTYGSLVEATLDLVDAAPEIVEFLPGGADDLVDGYLVVSIGFMSLLVTAYAVIAALRARSEEQAGRAEPVLATPVHRWAFSGAHALVALVGSAVLMVGGGVVLGLTAVATGSDERVLGDVVLASVVTVPAVWVVVGVAVLLQGVSARAGSLAWLALAWAAVVLLLADSLDLPGWARGVSPFHHLPQVPLEEASWGAPLVLTALGLALVAAGLAAFRRRDLATE
ncbi:ABC transporter permease [Aquipuribacter nitratireducens]|uniref:ABC transporter permease n=1 Tax=Aquipuribacter nitratireducens TaxID=650104 RepID=A0ABW0GMJ3_9MICO